MYIFTDIYEQLQTCSFQSFQQGRQAYIAVLADHTAAKILQLLGARTVSIFCDNAFSKFIHLLEYSMYVGINNCRKFHWWE